MAEVATTWRALIERSARNLEDSREHYHSALRAAIDAGVSYREVADAAGVSPATLHRHVGARPRPNLDSPARNGSEES